MGKEIQKSNIQLNSDGNQIIEEIPYGGGKTQKVKYGLIKFMGDRKEYRISYKTLIELNEAQNSGFKGKINIPEINMSVLISQIVMMRSEVETVRIEDNYTNLPVETIFLNSEFKILTGTRVEIERENDAYYMATCHYVVRNGIKLYYLEPAQIQCLAYLVRSVDASYPHYVKKATRYGRDIHEIYAEQKR